jgi:aminotransferase
MREIRAIHDYTGLCVPSVLQIALAGYLEKHNWGETYVSDLRIRLRKSLEILSSILISLGFHVPPVAGGYFIWSKMPEQCKDSFPFAVDLYEQEKVAVIPGIHFSPNANRIIRFNMAREESELIKGCEGLKRFFGR